MEKHTLSERDICTKFITPALRRAGWDEMSQIRDVVYLSKRDFSPFMMRLFAYQSHSSGSSRDSSGVQC